MKFIGQPHIMRELSIILPLAYAGQNYNILLKAPSGHGKTKMGLSMCSYVEKSFHVIIDREGSNIAGHIAGSNTRSIFVDEAHLINGVEAIYPFMDMGKYFLVFATNIGLLPEAFENRCIVFTFEPYSDSELEEITVSYFPRLRTTSSDVVRSIVENSQRNPRIIKGACQRLSTILGDGNITLESITSAYNNILNIHDGLDVRMRMYLETIRRLGTASLHTLSSILRMSEDIIRTEIEPVLLYKGLITVSSKGRSIVDG